MVTSGVIRRNASSSSHPRRVRGGRQPRPASLKREKDDASEVREGLSGLVLRNFQDIKEGDIVEAFEMREIPRS